MSEEKILGDLEEYVRKNVSVIFSLDCTGNSPRTRRNIQHMFELRPTDRKSRSEYETLLSHAVQAEKICPGSGKIFFHMLTGEISSLRSSLVRKKKDVLEEILSKNFSKFVTHLLLESLELSTSTTKISLKKSTSGNSFIEVSDGYSFYVSSMLKLQPQEVARPKVACIDGYVESVSEIHHLLTEISEEKVPCLFFSRGMSDDVLHTFKVNNDRKTLLVYPFVVPFDIDNVNTLVDIALTAGTDVISSNRGDLISSVNLKFLGSFESCNVSSSLVRAKNTSTRLSVLNHVRNLKNTCEERPEISEVLSKRIRSLTSDCIDICIPDDINFYSNSQQLDEGIRIISSVINNSYEPFLVAERFVKSYKDVICDTNRCLL